MKKVFIDGKAGTTGLRIYERLQAREDISLILLPDEERKNPLRRKEALNSCDLAFLCLPDDAARESVSMIENPDVRVVDTSTAHRTDPDWVYGFAELNPTRADAIAQAKRVAVPGCHAGGFVALVAPLVRDGLLPADALLTCHSLTGYSGGGKSMIAAYEASERDMLLDAPRVYGLTQQHKHLKEMQIITGLAHAPIFCPIVSDYYSGMLVTVPLFVSQLNGKSADDVRTCYRKYYNGPVVRYVESADENGFCAANAKSNLDSLEIYVCGNEERLTLHARFDNLGKGASGAAVQCMNLMLGCDPTTGLEL